MSIFAAWRRRSTPPAVEQTPFPTRQLLVLALCRLCEPIAFMSIFPYIYFMIRSFHVTEDDRHIAIYAGMVTSSFAFAEFSTSVLWGRLSDRIGRKPILLMGMAGTGISMITFGFAPNLPTALAARALGGLLNGNIGVLQTTVAEVVTVEAHQPRAYSIMPFVWCFGSILGYGLGGVLAEPTTNYPQFFQAGSIFERFPYLLPNLVCTLVVVMGLVIGVLFLEETHEDKKHKRDYGLECGNWILEQVCKTPQVLPPEKVGNFETLGCLAEGDQPPGYQTTEGTPRTSSSEESIDARQISVSETSDEHYAAVSKVSFRQAFTPQVILIIVGYGLLAFHTISCEQLFPVLLSMPQSSQPPTLPWHFTGGFGLTTKSIGFILSVQGVLQMFVQIFVYPVISRRFGPLRTFRGIILVYPMLYFVIPYLPLFPEILRMPLVYLVLLTKVTGQSLAYPSVSIMLNGAAPSKRVLGTVNGFAASSASLARALGPTIAGVIQSAGLRVGYSGIAWWFCTVIALMGALETLWMKTSQRANTSSNDYGSIDEEVAVVTRLLDTNMSEVDPTVVRPNDINPRTAYSVGSKRG